MKLIPVNALKEYSGKDIYFFTFLFLVMCFYIIKPVYDTNDDMIIIGILSGRFGPGLDTNPIFMSPLLGKAIAFLYHNFPSLPWYGIMLYSLLLISLFYGLRIITLLLPKSVERWGVTLVLLGLYMYICVRLNFGSCSLIVWLMIFLYAFFKNLSDKPVSYHDFLLSLLLFCSYLIRPDIIKIGLVLTIPLATTFFLTKTSKKRLLLMLIPLLIIVTISLVSPQYTKTMHPENYKKLQSIRSMLMDTNMGEINKNTDTALKMVGWSIADYKIFECWWSHDESIFGHGKMAKFLKYNNRGLDSVLAGVSLKDGLKRLYATKSFALLILSAAIILFARQRTSSNYISDLIRINYCNHLTIGIIVLIGLMIYGLACIRFPLRVAVPVYIYFLMLLVVVRPLIKFNCHTGNNKLIVILSILLVLCLNFIHIKALQQIAYINILHKNYTEKTIKTVQQLNGNDTVFLNLTPRDSGIGDSPLTEYRQNVSYNHVQGGWMIGTDLYYEDLEKYGVKSGRQLCGLAIDNPKAVFSFWQRPGSSFCVFQNYIVRHFGNHYGSSNKQYKLDLVLDKRYIDSKGDKVGWVYFKIKSIN